MIDLRGKKAVVTGGSGDIGGSIALMLHGLGAEVVVSGTRVGALDKVVSSLGDGAHAVACDLSSRTDVDRLISESESILGQVDILVNNAGVARDNVSLRMKDEDWEDVLRINLSSAFYLSRGFLRGMIKRRFGRIISVVSVIGFTGNVGQSNYAASKAGLVGMSKCLAQEFGSRGVTVNCVAPGFIETSMTSGIDSSRLDVIRGRIPLGRMGCVDDVSYAVCFLASDLSSYVTGETIHVNGGLAMC